MLGLINEIDSPLLAGIKPEDRKAMLYCIGYHVSQYLKGEVIVIEGDHL